MGESFIFVFVFSLFIKFFIFIILGNEVLRPGFPPERGGGILNLDFDAAE